MALLLVALPAYFRLVVPPPAQLYLQAIIPPLKVTQPQFAPVKHSVLGASHALMV